MKALRRANLTTVWKYSRPRSLTNTTRHQRDPPFPSTNHSKQDARTDLQAFLKEVCDSCADTIVRIKPMMMMTNHQAYHDLWFLAISRFVYSLTVTLMAISRQISPDPRRPRGITWPSYRSGSKPGPRDRYFLTHVSRDPRRRKSLGDR